LNLFAGHKPSLHRNGLADDHNGVAFNYNEPIVERIRPTSTPPWFIGVWAHVSQSSKRHLDQFTRFCRAHKRDQKTDTHTDLATLSVAITARILSMRCGL